MGPSEEKEKTDQEKSEKNEVFKSFSAEWVVNNAKCSREVKENKNKGLLSLIRKRSNTSLSVFSDVYCLSVVFRHCKLLIMNLIQSYFPSCLLFCSPRTVSMV